MDTKPCEMAQVIEACDRIIPLGFWLALCEKVGIPYIPAAFSPAFPMDEVYEALDGNPTPKLDAALGWAKAEIARRTEAGERVMFRYECCATDELKYHAAEGHSYETPGFFREVGGEYLNPWRHISIDDLRLLDLTVWPETRCCVRPWIEAHRVGGWPLEFRVFFGTDGYQGVSSYYPQRPLPKDNWYIDRAILLAQSYAERLYAAETFAIGCTMDFLVEAVPGGELGGENDRVLFLEGGPPHHQGPRSAHPCCFPPGKIEGIALSRQPGALTR